MFTQQGIIHITDHFDARRRQPGIEIGQVDLLDPC
jgi:hypothetical protein